MPHDKGRSGRPPEATAECRCLQQLEGAVDLLREIADEANWVEPEAGGYSDVTLADDLIVRLRALATTHPEPRA